MTNAAANAAFENSYTLFSLDGGQGTNRVLESIAANKCPVLIVGEAGTGKRKVGQRIHAASSRHRDEFRVMNCGSADELEIEEALSSAGTLYLSGIGEANRALQTLLLEHAWARQKNDSHARLICGSSHALSESLRSGNISEDFFYAIAGVTLHTVPLRHRRNDLIAIADHFLQEIAQQMGKEKPVLDSDFRSFLGEHTWPGNLAELEAAMRTCVAVGDQQIALAALKASLAKTRNASEAGTSLKRVSKTASLRAERELIYEILHATGGNRKQAARELKISYKALLYKLKQIGMERDASSAVHGELG
jgi:two-component system response regulator AtoC